MVFPPLIRDREVAVGDEQLVATLACQLASSPELEAESDSRGGCRKPVVGLGEQVLSAVHPSSGDELKRSAGGEDVARMCDGKKGLEVGSVV